MNNKKMFLSLNSRKSLTALNFASMAKMLGELSGKKFDHKERKEKSSGKKAR